MFSIFNSYTHHYEQCTGNNLAGKTILDIGPGISLAVPLMLKDSGSRMVYAIEPFLPKFAPKYHALLYKSIRDRIRLNSPDAVVDSLDYCIHHNTHIAQQIRIHRCKLEEAYNIQDGIIDVSFSNATLEHIADPISAFNHLFRVTSRCGYGLHLVDFRDHADSENPLGFLLFDKQRQREYMEMRHNFAMGNGRRYSEYIELFKSVGFEIVSVEPTLFAEDDYMKGFLPKLRSSNSPHKDWPEEDLRVLSAHFIVRKN
jgi:hypothetical protein